MPKLAIYRALVFFLFSYDLSERMHVHISNTKSRKGRSAKIWLDTLEIFEQGDLSDKEINTVLKLLQRHKSTFEKSIQEFAQVGTVKTINL